MQLKYSKNSAITGILATIILTLIVSHPIIGPSIWNPNNHMFTFGGDGLTIYYDMIYHIKYGKGQIFEGMNYPYGELIFMTDAQGSLSLLLNWINNHITDISEYTVGIVNFLNGFSVLLCSVIIYLILRKFDVNLVIAIVFSTLITVLSPQIFRLVSHFGLAYLFAIPTSFYWIIQKSKKINFGIFDLVFLLFVIFITFNNPYVGFILSSTIILSGFYMWMYHHLSLKYMSLSFLGLIPLVITYVYLKVSDPVRDRIKVQWGYFDLNTKIEGIIAPKGSLVDGLLNWFGYPSYELDFENILNIGLSTWIILCLIFVMYFIKKNTFKRFRIPEDFKPVLFSSSILLAYSSGIFFTPFNQEFIEDKLHFLLMFKAIGRLSWPFYYALTILAVLFLNHLYLHYNKWIILPLIITLAVIWNWEINTYVALSFKNKKHDNFLGNSQAEKVLKILEDNNIDANDYQAILSLPKLMTWTDNFISEVNWSSQYHSMNISRVTGLPLINAMLSRMSISQTAEKIELLAHPYVKKTFVNKLPNKKDILIVLGHDYPPLTEGELYLLRNSDTLYNEPNGFTLLKLPIENINKYHDTTPFREKYKDSLITNNAFYYEGFDSQKSNFIYFGNGAKAFNKGNHKIFFGTIHSPSDNVYSFSAWTRFDHMKYGIGWFTCQVKNSSGDIIFNETPDTRRSNDVHGEWIRTQIDFPVHENCTVLISFNTNRTLFIDEVLIRPKNTTHILYENENEMLIDGYKVKTY